MAVTDWIQPANMWANVGATLTFENWNRSIVFDIDGLSDPDYEALFQSTWTDILGLSSAAFAALSGVGRIVSTSESSSSTGLPASSYQHISTVHTSNLGFTQLDAGLTAPEPPLYVPSLGPGQTVEYEAAEGTYLDQWRFRVIADPDGDFATGQPPPRMVYAVTDSYLDSSTYPGSDATFQGWDTADLGLAQPWEPVEISATEPTITVLALFDAQFTGVPRVDSPRSGLVTLGRESESTPAGWLGERLYTPPRHRIHTNLGQWSLRQRQTPAGVAGGWPLRHKQNGGASGAWPLRHR